MSEMYEPMRQMFERIHEMINNKRWIATGVVKKVRKSDRKIKVAIMPEFSETDWLKVYYFNAGDDYMTGQMPEVDSEVVLLFIGADPNAAIVLAGGFSQKDKNPPTIEDDYAIPIYDKYGNSVVLDSKGITIKSKADINITVDGNAKVDATSIELGDGGTEKLLKGETFQSFFNSHTHPTGVGPSGPPTIPSNPAHLTTVTKAK